MLQAEFSSFGVNTMPVDDRAHKVAIAFAGMVLVVWDW